MGRWRGIWPHQTPCSPHCPALFIPVMFSPGKIPLQPLVPAEKLTEAAWERARGWQNVTSKGLPPALCIWTFPSSEVDDRRVCSFINWVDPLLFVPVVLTCTLMWLRKYPPSLYFPLLFHSVNSSLIGQITFIILFFFMRGLPEVLMQINSAFVTCQWADRKDQLI